MLMQNEYYVIYRNNWFCFAANVIKRLLDAIISNLILTGNIFENSK